MSKLDELKRKALSNPEVKAEYEALDQEFALVHTLLSMRQAAGLTQSQVADRMGTKEANISRLEKGTGNPTVKTLMRYAAACGCNLDFGFKHA